MPRMRSRLVALLTAAPLWLCACDGGTTNPSEPAGVVLFRLVDLDGAEVEVTTVRGGRTILAFWATWCGPCEVELGKLDSLYADMRSRGLVVYAINVDDSSTAAEVGGWVERQGYRFPVLLDGDSRILARYQPRKEIPYLVVLDGEGRIVEEHAGAAPEDIDALRDRLEQVLPE